ncbi:MAG: hypothetical protein CL662_01055 [Bacteroidetes bacterium]|nr:hypothetical protein [Bacteroidota bacterium]|tara:strand:+ start:1948 stop:2265 length:318 start_codon:yes stop_codon:yes gene_type:complete
MGWENCSYFNCRFSYNDYKAPPPLEEAYIRQPKFYNFNKAEEYNYKTSYNNDSIHPVFGIKKSSSMEEFKEVYRQMILETHPDKGGDNQEFIRVREAWDELTGHP